MENTVRNKMRFNGTPEPLNAIVQAVASEDGKDPLSFERIIPLEPGDSKEEKWGVPSGPEELDWILYRDGTVLEYTFDTLGKTPLPIFQKIAEKYPECRMTVEYADEDYGENCGKYVSEEGSTELKPVEPDEEPFDFACLLWDKDPDEERQELMINAYEE
ncbi:MAG: hypothetical protein IKE28_02715 [Solobacterium sp.]|nr:hypothetical protein [Solobacterium sp.]